MAGDPVNTPVNVNVNAVELATSLTIAWLANPHTQTPAEEVPAFLGRMHQAVSALLGGTTKTAAVATPTDHERAVSVRKSLASKDHILSMIDGKPYKTLRRHLSRHGLTPEEYRARYGLNADYPMVAEAYSEKRRAMARELGLGRKAGESPKREAMPARKGKSLVDAKAAAQAHPGGREG